MNEARDIYWFTWKTMGNSAELKIAFNILPIALQTPYAKYHNIKISIVKITSIFTFVVNEWI